jgi:hypothetical protein
LWPFLSQILSIVIDGKNDLLFLEKPLAHVTGSVDVSQPVTQSRLSGLGIWTWPQSLPHRMPPSSGPSCPTMWCHGARGGVAEEKADHHLVDKSERLQLEVLTPGPGYYHGNVMIIGNGDSWVWFDADNAILSPSVPSGGSNFHVRHCSTSEECWTSVCNRSRVPAVTEAIESIQIFNSLWRLDFSRISP